MVTFVVLQMGYLINHDWHRLLSNLSFSGIFITIEILVGLIQLVQASYFNDGGRSLKYIAFAPWYILIYWMVNTYTVAVEIVPTIRQIIRGKDAGVWKSPKRSTELTGKPEWKDSNE